MQKAGDQVRVNVQLINGETDSHLWAETFDRKVTDIFGVESEIAKGIAESLEAKLTGGEKQALAAKPTNNPEAYETYLRGLAFEGHIDYGDETKRKAIGFYERAVQLDPNFAVAWARLSHMHAALYHSTDATSGRRDAAKRALDNAQKLAPNSPETLLALGYYQMRVLDDHGAAKGTYGRVSKMLPGSSEVLLALAYSARAEGNWDQSIAYYDQALTSDPRNMELLLSAAATHVMLRQFPAALRLYDRVLDIARYDPDVMAKKAMVYQAQGNLQEAARLLSGINEQTPNEEAFGTKLNQLDLERNFGEEIRLMQARLAQFHFSSQFEKGYNQVLLALMQHRLGDTAGAKVNAEQARHIPEQIYADQPENAIFAEFLSLAYAATGEKDSALKMADHAIMRGAKDPVDGPTYEENLAFIQAMFGENSRAISTLTKLLRTPYGFQPITPAFLRLDPRWDPFARRSGFPKTLRRKAGSNHEWTLMDTNFLGKPDDHRLHG